MFIYLHFLAVFVFSLNLQAMPDFTPRYYENFVVDNRRLPEGSRAARMASELAQYRGRHFTQEEFAILAPKLLKITQEIYRFEGRSDSSDACFAGDCRVLTPYGYRRIRVLRPGDDVFSIDVKTGELIDNQIAQTFMSFNKSVGELRGMGLSQAPVVGTRSHPYFSPSTDNYQALEAIPETRELLSLAPTLIGARHALLRPVRRGPFYRHPNRMSVFNLHLRHDPNNFCVENLVVHNMIMKF